MIAAALLLLVPTQTLANHRRGLGSIRHSDDYQRREYDIEIRYRDRDALRLQREAISAEEEARRELQRTRRRDEIEREAEDSLRDFLESQEEIRAASRAARRSPRGFYYRRPGTTLPSLPAGYSTLKVGREEYFYFGGIFFRGGAGEPYAVTAPRGAVVDSLPEGHLTVRPGDRELHYYFGTFFEPREGGYVVVAPPDGTVVPYIPDGYSSEKIGGSLHFVFGGVRYRPVYREGTLVYVVSGP